VNAVDFDPYDDAGGQDDHVNARMLRNLRLLGLTNEHLAPLGGRLPEKTQESGGDFSFLPQSEIDEAIAAFGTSAEAFKADYKILVAGARVMGVDPSQFAEFWTAMAQRLGTTVATLAFKLSSEANPLDNLYPSSGDAVTNFDPEAFFQMSFAAYPDAVAPYQQPASDAADSSTSLPAPSRL
jgi:hypothetical protein